MAVRIKVGDKVVEVDTEEDFMMVAKSLNLFDESPELTGSGASPAPRNGTRTSPASAEGALLTVLVAGGEVGVEGAKIAQMIGSKGRGFNGAISKWAQKVGLVPDGSDTDVLVKARIGTKRGWKLTPGALETGRHLLGRK